MQYFEGAKDIFADFFPICPENVYSKCLSLHIVWSYWQATLHFPRPCCHTLDNRKFGSLL